MNKNCGA